MIFDLKHLVLKCFSRNAWSLLFFLCRFCCLCSLLQSCGKFTQFRLYISPMLFNIASGSIQGLRLPRRYILCLVLLLFFLWLIVSSFNRRLWLLFLLLFWQALSCRFSLDYLFITAQTSWRTKSCHRLLVFILGHHNLPGLKVGQEIIINWLITLCLKYL